MASLDSWVLVLTSTSGPFRRGVLVDHIAARHYLARSDLNRQNRSGVGAA